jgi:thymidylate synthase
MSINASQIAHKFKPCYKPNQLILGYGQIAVVTGWTVRESVAKKLDNSEYAVIGQLYSATRGIDFLVRNLLLNPHVRTLIIINATKEDRNAGSCQCLLDFFQKGYFKGKSDTGKDCWVVNSEITGYIDIEVSETALDKLRSSLNVEMQSSIAEAVERVHALAKDAYDSWGEAIEFPKIEQESTILRCMGIVSRAKQLLKLG